METKVNKEAGVRCEEGSLRVSDRLRKGFCVVSRRARSPQGTGICLSPAPPTVTPSEINGSNGEEGRGE